MSETLTYKIDTFEGPLDLLLALIAKNKMDIKDIRITVIFAQYMEYLERMKQMDMEIAGEFIVMASELMLIKSRMLLPRAEEEEEDPRARLAEALLAYKRAKEAALYLEEQYAVYSRRYAKDTEEIPADSRDIAPQDLEGLQRALMRLFSRKEREDAPPPMGNINPIIKKPVVPVADRLRAVSEQLAKEGCIPFLALFGTAQSKSEMVATFLAVLALIKDGHVTLEKRLELQSSPENGSALPDEGGEYEYTYYCALNPESELPEDFTDAYEEND